MVYQESFQIQTSGRGTSDITARIQTVIASSGVQAGLCHVFIHHTSASLILCENADSDVRADLETFMARLVPDGDKDFVHTAEGADDMPAHIRSVLTETGLSVPIVNGRCGLGTWQGIYLWEHRTNPNTRSVTVTLLQ